MLLAWVHFGVLILERAFCGGGKDLSSSSLDIEN